MDEDFFLLCVFTVILVVILSSCATLPTMRPCPEGHTAAVCMMEDLP